MKLNLKKLFALATVICLAGLILAGCGSSNSKKDNSVKNIQNKKTIVLGTSADFAPYEFPVVQNGQKKIIGYDILIAQKIAKRLGVKLKIENIAFPSLVTELKNNKVDFVMSGMIKTKSRAKVVNFSKPYYTGGNVLLIRKADQNKFTSNATLKNHQIGAQQSSEQQKIGASQLNKATMVTESSINTLTAELLNKNLDGVVMGKDVAETYVVKFPRKYAIAKITLKTPKGKGEIRAAVQKGDNALLKEINQEITSLKNKGQLDALYKQAKQLQLKYDQK